MFEGERFVIHDKKFRKFISKEKIAEAVNKVAGQINVDYAGKEIIFVVTLKGSIFFTADLMRLIYQDCTLEVISAKSYGSEMEISGNVKLVNLLPNIEGKHIIILEDIVDSGLTIKTLKEKISQSNPASVAACTLLSKPEMRKVDVEVEYVGIEIPPEFVVGYGLDFDEQGRQLPDIYVLDEEV
jgi:hypoxanthine phosphoribosyltransferase